MRANLNPGRSSKAVASAVTTVLCVAPAVAAINRSWSSSTLDRCEEEGMLLRNGWIVRNDRQRGHHVIYEALPLRSLSLGGQFHPYQ
jgi:hypothetical protein